MVDAPPIMLSIAMCESGAQQFAATGNVIRDHVYGTHVGIYQLSKHWQLEAGKLGLDVVHSAADNIKMALQIYKQYGTSPWRASKMCWGSEYSWSLVVANDYKQRLGSTNNKRAAQICEAAFFAYRCATMTLADDLRARLLPAGLPSSNFNLGHHHRRPCYQTYNRVIQIAVLHTP